MSAAPAANLRALELTCVVVEDQGMFMEMLGSMLSMRGGVRVAASAPDVAAGKAACAKHAPDLLVLDLDLPDGSGLAVAEHLLLHNSAARIIIVSGHAGGFVCPEWLNDNLQAVISKNDTFTALRQELDELLAFKRPAPRAKKDFADKLLSGREAEIFALMGEGLTTKEIAAKLHLSEHTVQSHRKRMAAKLGTWGSELVQRAIEHRVTFFSPEKGQN